MMQRNCGSLERGEIPIFEPGLQELVHRNMGEERLFFASEIAAHVASADAVFIAVGRLHGATMDMRIS